MNKANVAKFHKLLKADVPKKEIAAILKVDPKTLAKFTPEAFEAAKKAKEPKETKETKKA